MNEEQVASLQVEAIASAHARLKMISEERQLRYELLLRDIADHDRASYLREARETGIQQGIETGLKQGRQEGLQQGLQQGLHQGRQQGALELLRELREQGVLSEGEFIARRSALVTAGENRE